MKPALFLTFIVFLCLFCDFASAHEKFQNPAEQIPKVEPSSESTEKKDEKEEIKKKTAPSKIGQYLKDYPNLKKKLDKFVNGGLENLVVILLITYTANYVFGNYRNQKISSEWLD